MKQKIKISHSTLNKIISESIKRQINEISYDKYNQAYKFFEETWGGICNYIESKRLKYALTQSPRPSKYMTPLFNHTVELIEELANILEKVEDKFENAENNLSDLKQKEDEELAEYWAQEEANGTN